jgi:porphyrinogen peroxidase
MVNADSMIGAESTNALRATPQSVVVPLTRDTIFLVVTVNPEAESLASVRALCGELPKLLRAVGFRDQTGNMSCVMGFGSIVWERLFAEPRPAELHPFREISAGSRCAVATPGDRDKAGGLVT